MLRRLVTSSARSPALFHALRSLLDPGQPDRLRDLLRGVPHTAIVELGCGTGGNHAMTDRRYLGVDRDPDYVAYATRRWGSPTAGFITGDLLAPLELPGGPFDLAALLNVIHHLTDDEVRTALARVRTAGIARMLVVDVTQERTSVLFRRVFGPLDRGTRFRATGEIRALLESGGLVIEREEGWATGLGIWPRAAFVGRFG